MTRSYEQENQKPWWFKKIKDNLFKVFQVQQNKKIIQGQEDQENWNNLFPIFLLSNNNPTKHCNKNNKTNKLTKIVFKASQAQKQNKKIIQGQEDQENWNNLFPIFFLSNNNPTKHCNENNKTNKLTKIVFKASQAQKQNKKI